MQSTSRLPQLQLGGAWFEVMVEGTKPQGPDPEVNGPVLQMTVKPFWRTSEWHQAAMLGVPNTRETKARVP